MRTEVGWGAASDGTCPPLRGDARAEVCVVGLGAAGLHAVARLRQCGRDVIGLDAATIGGGASGRNGGFLLAGAADFHHDAVSRHGRERAVALHALTSAELERTARDHPGVVRPTGSLRIAADDEERADCERHLAALRRDGIVGVWYEGDEGEGLLLPDDACFDPVARCRELAAPLVAAGARLHEATRVVEVAAGHVQTAAASITCDAVVVCVDGGLESLVPELEGRVRSARAQMLATAPTTARFSRPVYARWGLDYWQQLPDGRVFLGGARDMGGAEEWTTRARPTDRVQAELDALLARSGGDAEVTHRWAGVIAFTGDRLPVVEQVRPGIFVAGAYSGTGNLLGPLAGRAVADLAMGEASEVARLIASDPEARISDS
jgi:gamma-glutamylputrescine oxidase